MKPDICLAGFGPISDGVPRQIGDEKRPTRPADADITKRYRKVKK